MKRAFIGGILTLFLFGGNLGAAEPHKICATHYYIVEPVKLMPVLLKYHRELHLTEEQKEEIKREIRLIKEKIIPLDRAIDKLSEKVRHDMLVSDNRLLVEGEMRVLANLKVERSLYNYKCIRDLKRILTKEQFEKLLKLAGY